ncbi:MAG: uridine kinase [Chloroflexi bacterium]|nr:uridine kinase [Chloroflexota bacterium]MBW7878149.1 uridine kinase [Anaerolineae bacterium]MDL1914551.1 uridine kinase [Anaerolineae bacterium CFX4]OQY84216.1 MAG: uridine kinase [Anaerolineae bacterium UTCFX5]MCC6565898.1 uridine kinase [Chloroflexota bacterium]
MGVAGGTGSGKTTAAMAIVERVGSDKIAYLPHDAYYRELNNLPPDKRATVNFDHPDSLDTPLMIEHIKRLRNWEPVEIPVYDFTIDARTDRTIHVDPQPIILVEGILIFAEPELRSLLDFKIFVDTDSDIRFIRRLQRDIRERGRSVENVIEQYLRTVRPMHLEFVEPSRRYADIIIPQMGFDHPAIDMVADRVRALAMRGTFPRSSRS